MNAVSACRCGARYEPQAFESLSPVRTLEVDEIAPLVVRWPDGVVVDVRTCAKCHAPMARLTQRATTGPAVP